MRAGELVDVELRRAGSVVMIRRREERQAAYPDVLVPAVPDEVLIWERASVETLRGGGDKRGAGAATCFRTCPCRRR